MTYETKTVVAIAALVIDKFGYRKDYKNGSLDNTKNYVRIMYDGLFGEIRDAREKELYDEKLKPLVSKSVEYTKKAEEILNWIRNFDVKTVSGQSAFFLSKMKYAAKGDEIYSKDLGYIACLPVSYKKNAKPTEPTPEPVKESPKVVLPPKVEDKPIDKPVEPPKVELPSKPIEKTTEPEESKSNGTIEIDGMKFGDVPGFMPTPDWMRKVYEVFNKKYFDNQLPGKNELDFMISKRASRWAGEAGARIRKDYRGNIIDIKTTFIKLAVMGLHTEKHTCEIMLHEMIHVWQYSVEKSAGGHGYDFIKEMNRINTFGWTVETTESWENQAKDVENPEIKKNFERLKMIAFWKTNRDITGFSLISKTSLPKFKSYARDLIKCNAFKGIAFYTFNDASGFYKNYTVNSISSGFRGYRKDAKEIKDLISSGKIELESSMGTNILDESTFEAIYNKLNESQDNIGDNDTPIAKVGEMYITDYGKEENGDMWIDCVTR